MSNNLLMMLESVRPKQSSFPLDVVASYIARFLLVAAIFAGLVQGQQTDGVLPVWTSVPPKTPFLHSGPAMYNGSAWRSWTDDFKTAYLVGINEGGFYMGVINCQCYHALLPASKTVGEVKQLLDNFFADPKNIRIHVVEALSYIEFEASSATASEKAQRKTDLRKANE